jgi:hypothetical protein
MNMATRIAPVLEQKKGDHISRLSDCSKEKTQHTSQCSKIVMEKRQAKENSASNPTQTMYQIKLQVHPTTNVLPKYDPKLMGM